MKNVTHKLKVYHIPQVPMKAFEVEVRNEREAFLVLNTLIYQHCFLFDNNVIPDYSNVAGVQMLENGEWCDYYNEDEMMEWDELVETYEDELI